MGIWQKRLGKMVEHQKSKSTQLRSMSTLYDTSEKVAGIHRFTFHLQPDHNMLNMIRTDLKNKLTLHRYLVLITFSDGQLSSSGDNAAAAASSCASVPPITNDSDKK